MSKVRIKFKGSKLAYCVCWHNGRLRIARRRLCRKCWLRDIAGDPFVMLKEGER